MAYHTGSWPIMVQTGVGWSFWYCALVNAYVSVAMSETWLVNIIACGYPQPSLSTSDADGFRYVLPRHGEFSPHHVVRGTGVRRGKEVLLSCFLGFGERRMGEWINGTD